MLLQSKFVIPFGFYVFILTVFYMKHMIFSSGMVRGSLSKLPPNPDSVLADCRKNAFNKGIQLFL